MKVQTFIKLKIILSLGMQMKKRLVIKKEFEHNFHSVWFNMSCTIAHRIEEQKCVK